LRCASGGPEVLAVELPTESHVSNKEKGMTDTSRREFSKQALSSLLTFSLLETLFERDAFAESIKPVTVRWLAELNDLSSDLKDEKLKQIAWQSKVEELFAHVDLPQLLQLVDFQRLTSNLQLVDRGARSLRFKFRQIEGVPTNLVFGKQIFAVKKDRSVVPHGHNNMATAFLILKGSFHGRHYDRLEDETDHIIIKPTIDQSFGSGGYSTISDYKDNVHWFKASSEPSFIFNIHVLNLPFDDTRPTGRVYLDPDGEQLSDGRIRARRIRYKEAYRLYG